ncbi:MAG: hypothetical protein ACRDZ4_19680 [Egibacteraceae bacterium]
MVVDERARHELFDRLEDVLGAEHAVTVMEHLPPVGWADVATKHDLSAQIGLARRDLAAEIGLVRRDLSAEIGLVRRDLAALEERLDLRIEGLSQEFRSEIGSVRQELRSGIGSVRQELRSGIGSVRLEMSEMKQETIAVLRAELSNALTAQTRTLMFTVLAALTSMTALVLAAGRF